MSIVTHMIDLNTQWCLSKQSKCTLHPKCDICGLQSYFIDQHDLSKMRSTDSSSSSVKPFSQINSCSSMHPPDCSSSYRANFTDSLEPMTFNSEGSLPDTDAYANIAKLPDTTYTMDTLNEDEFFICVSTTIISPSLNSSTHYFDALADGALVSLIKTLLDSGCTTHIFKDKKYF